MYVVLVVFRCFFLCVRVLVLHPLHPLHTMRTYAMIDSTMRRLISAPSTYTFPVSGHRKPVNLLQALTGWLGLLFPLSLL